MVSRFFEVTRYNAIVTRYGRVTLPKIFLLSGRKYIFLEILYANLHRSPPKHGVNFGPKTTVRYA